MIATDAVIIERSRSKRQDITLDPTRAAEAAKAVIESIRAVAEGDGDLIADMVEGETDFYEVVDRIVGKVAETDAYILGVKAQIESLKGRQERFEKRVAMFRSLIEQALTIAGLPRAERPCATLSMSARPPKLVIDTEADIPAEFWETGDPVLDKKALKAAIEARSDEIAKAGETTNLGPIPGAHLEESAPSLTLRIK